MAVNTHKTLSPDIFTHEKRLCVLDVSFTLLETAGKPEFMSMDIGAFWQEQYILPIKATDLQSQIFKKKCPMFHLSLHYTKSLIKLF